MENYELDAAESKNGNNELEKDKNINGNN